MTAWTSVALEVELTAGVWTDVTSYLDYDAAPVVIRQGRPTEFDDPGPGTLTFALRNDTGRFVPGNVGSPLWPYWRKGIRCRWKVTKGGTTYTRIVAWITALAPSFPGTSTVSAVVAVTAVDALGKLAQRKLRSRLTEDTLYRARAAATHVDVYEARPDTASNVATMTQYSTDPAAGAPATFWGSAPNLSFGTDDDVSFGGVVTCQAPTSNTTLCGFQASNQFLCVHLKTPVTAPTSGTWEVTTFHTSPGGGASRCHLSFAPDGGGGTNLRLRNAADTADIVTISGVSPGQWIRVEATVNAGNAALSDWRVVYQDGVSSGGTSAVAVDIRTIRAAEFPTATADMVATSWGGVIACGASAVGSPRFSFSGATAGSLVNEVTRLGFAVSQLPVTISTTGTLSADLLTGRWDGRPASEVLQEMLRTYSGLAWARSRDSVVYAIGSDQLYPASPVATIDTDGDCLGTPDLVDGAEQRPTRIDVEWPGGTTSVVDTTAEAGGEIRSRRVATVAPTGSAAAAVGLAMFGRLATADVRISRVTVDLLSGATDHTAALFSESGTLSGLYPTQRVRFVVPASHFGSSTVDAHVQGWTETYSPDRATVTLDTTPTPSGVLLTGLTVTNASTTVTSSTSVFGSGDVGKIITGVGIPAGTTIETYVSGTQVTISQPATQTGTGVWGTVSTKLIAVDWWGGADGASWSSRWVAGVTSTGGSATCQGGRGRLAAGTVANNGTVRRISGVTFTDGEIVTSLLFSASQGFALVGYRGDTGTAQDNVYYCGLRASGLFLGKTVATVPTTLGTWAPSTFTPGVLYRLRIRAVGSEHRARLWQASQPEPSGWNITVTDATFTSGSISLKGSNDAGTGAYAEFDDLAVTKEG